MIFVYTVYDADNESATIAIDFVSDDPVSVDGIPDMLADVWDIISPLQTGRLGAAFCRIGGAVSTESADVLSDVQEKAFFGFGTDEENGVTTEIPCFLETLFENGGAGPIVDTSQTDVAAFITLMTTGGLSLGGGNVLHHVNAHGDFVTEFNYARQFFKPRKRRKRRIFG